METFSSLLEVTQKGGGAEPTRVSASPYPYVYRLGVIVPFGRGVKILATSGERVNHDLWVKMCNLCRGLKTSILAELTVRSGLGDIYVKMMSLLCYYVHLIIVYAMN